jgi:hypothetical protein
MSLVREKDFKGIFFSSLPFGNIRLLDFPSVPLGIMDF